MEASNLTGAAAIPELTEQNDLESFRAEWRRELETTQKKSSCSDDSQQETDIHKKAQEYFKEGVAMEESGNLYDAIKFYKRAVQLVPDIEREVYNTNLQTSSAKNRSSSVPRREDVNQNPVQDSEVGDEEDKDLGNLVDRFNRAVHLDNQPAIQQEFNNANTVHIGCLPAEVLNYILKWVVSADLDIRSLESCALVCKGLYLAVRDNEIWRQICVRGLGRAALTSNTSGQPWRDFYLTRARVHFHGVYVSKMTYIREGERGFQDHESYRAWHMVTYYRLIRLFPGGRILMVLSAEDPGLTAKLMNNRNFCSIQGGLFGEYRVVDNKLVCVLHKQKQPKKVVSKFRRKRRDSMIYNETPDCEYMLEFQIKGKRGKILVWSDYQIVSRYPSGRETCDSVTLSDQKFPRMQFNRVGSYHFDSSAPL